MHTNWKLIRDALNTAIDSCEALELAGYQEGHRNQTVEINGISVSLQDFLVSGWTMPENLRYAIIRQRHDDAMDLPYTPETARIMMAVTAACAELVGAGAQSSSTDAIKGMIDWFRDHFDPNVARMVKRADD
ncbi:hypothetical protein [Paraburkholderia bannensis]|uniref:hypothetical protein n=1 Tax=Paraburkholderia bannensis TaxID=765414 RepID=UPI0004850E54|nr:hypothetical protein [Paraburkholderia bannensis]